MVRFQLNKIFTLRKSRTRYMYRCNFYDFLGVSFEEIMAKLMADGESLKSFIVDVRGVKNADIGPGKYYPAADPLLIGALCFNVDILRLGDLGRLNRKLIKSVFLCDLLAASRCRFEPKTACH